MSFLSRLFFPPKCIFCKELLPLERAEAYCEKCESELPFITGRICIKCSRPIQAEHSLPVCLNCRKEKYPFHKVYVPFLYQGNVRNAILNLKFHDRKSVSAPLADFLWNKIEADTSRLSYDFVTAVPLSKKRKRMRGYNQSELLGKQLALRLDIPFLEALIKIRETKNQSTLNFKERKENLKGAFCINKTLELKGKTVLLVDDVLTTGSTASECTRVLRRAGVKAVDIAVIAATPEKKE